MGEGQGTMIWICFSYPVAAGVEEGAKAWQERQERSEAQRVDLADAEGLPGGDNGL
jgi:hypothetical protein